jgi:hypothetical protein
MKAKISLKKSATKKNCKTTTITGTTTPTKYKF